MTWRYLIVVSVALAVDRWLKWLAQTGRTWSSDIGSFVLFKNDALVFSWPAPRGVIYAVTIMALAVMSYLAWRRWVHWRIRQKFGWCLIGIGALSNLYDRLVFGYVIDWGNFGRWFPVFNLADVLIVTGLIFLIFSPGIDNRRSVS